ncbi:6496_t:CDS:1, partial [Diversispora eburnea]
GRNISDIAYEICNEYLECKKHNNHVILTTPSILHKRITFACLQYTIGYYMPSLFTFDYRTS